MARWGQVGLAVFLAVGLLLRGLLVQRVPIELDEFEHLHAGYLVASGQVPYHDFFEHHTPLFYLFAGGLIDPASADFDTILGFRWFSYGANILAMALVGVLGWQVNRAVGVMALVFALLDIFSFAWGSLVFLDSFAIPLILASAIIMARRPDGRAAHVLVGVLLGTAVMFTQKAVFPSLAPIILTLLRAPQRRPGDLRWFGALGWLAAGAAVPCCMVAALLGTAGVAAFWHSVLVLSATWQARRWPVGEVFLIASYSLPIWLLAGAGTLAALWRGRSITTLTPPVLTAVVYLLTLSMGVLLLPTVWYEYFIEISPFAAVVAAVAAVDIGRLFGWLRGRLTLLSDDPRWRWFAIAAVLGGTLLSLGIRMANAHYSPSPSLLQLGLALGLIAAATATAMRLVRTAQSVPAVAAVLVAACALPLAYQVTWLERGGLAYQRSAVDLVQARVSPAAAVFDGYSGFGVFRPHAYLYWLLHDETVQMLTPAERGARIVEALSDTRVQVAIRDEFTRLLEPEVQQYLDQNFVPVSGGPIWVRRAGTAG